jgi:hypothetical protein
MINLRSWFSANTWFCAAGDICHERAMSPTAGVAR